MTTKADAHFVDCDLATGDGGNWTAVSEQSTFKTVIMPEGQDLRILSDLTSTPTVTTYTSFFAPNETVSGGGCQIGDYIYIPVVYHASNQTCIVRVDMSSGTPVLEADWADTPSSGWAVTQSGVACRASSAEDAVFLRTVNDDNFYKFNLDGSCEWEYIHGSDSAAYDMDVDSSDRPYGAYFDFQGCRISANGSGVDQVYATSTIIGIGSFACIVDDDNGYVYFAGLQNGSPPGAGTYYAMHKFDISGAATPVSPELEASISGMASGDGIHVMRKYGSYLYCKTTSFTYNGDTRNIFILDLNFNVVASAYLANAASLFSDGSYLYVVRDTATYGAGTDTIYRYSLDDLSNPTAINAGKVEFDNQVINRNLFFIFDSSNTTANYQYRTIAYPSGYGHLEGQEVQVLADGIYLDDDTYTISSGAVTPTYTATTDHVGLKVISKLQPMKLDGEVNVKRIAQIIPDVYESVGGYYGEDLTTLYTMELRSSNDPMDRDGSLKTGYIELPFNGVYDRQGDIWIQQDIPLPMHVLGLGVRLSKEAV